jgi:hypothetical protein
MVAITFRTDDPIRWGTGHGSDLDPAEVDINFWDLKTAVEALQASLPSAITISSITATGTNYNFHLSDGSTVGPVPVPVIQFRWRGVWAPLTVYSQLDTFRVDGVGLYSVLVDHTSAASFDESALDGGGNAEYFKLFGFSGISGVAFADLIGVTLSGLADKDFLVYDLPSDQFKNVSHAQATADLDALVGDSGSGGTKGLVPAPPAGAAAAGKFLKADGTWAVAPGGTGSVSLAGDTDVSIASPANNDVLQYRSSDGKWHNTPLGSLGGTVTRIAAGPGISTGGSDITTTGTVSLATIANLCLLANISGITAVPLPTTFQALLDAALGSVRGSIIQRAAAGWAVLLPGSAGQYLKTQGAGADNIWDSPAGSGTVTSVDVGPGLSAGGTPITGVGTISFAAIADGKLLANVSGGSAAPTDVALTLLLDHIIGSTRGSFLQRTASGWTLLTPGTAGYVLQSGGAGADASWAAASGSDVAYAMDVVSTGTTHTIASLSAKKTALVWRSATAGSKTSDIPAASGYDGYVLVVKLTQGDGSAHSIVPGSGTIDGQATADFVDSGTVPRTSITLLADGPNNEWLVI